MLTLYKLASVRSSLNEHVCVVVICHKISPKWKIIVPKQRKMSQSCAKVASMAKIERLRENAKVAQSRAPQHRNFLEGGSKHRTGISTGGHLGFFQYGGPGGRRLWLPQKMNFVCPELHAKFHACRRIWTMLPLSSWTILPPHAQNESSRMPQSYRLAAQRPRPMRCRLRKVQSLLLRSIINTRSV